MSDKLMLPVLCPVCSTHFCPIADPCLNAMVVEWHRLTAEIEELRLMWRCERHGGHDPETHCYPCHTENLTKAEAQNAALVEALEFYADEESWKGVGMGISKAEAYDQGYIARTALEQQSE